MTKFLPEIDPAAGVDADPDYSVVYDLVKKSRALIGKSWPSDQENGTYKILICPGTDVAVKTRATNDAAGPITHTLFFGLRALDSPFGNLLTGAISRQEATTLLLGHETFHLSQAARMRKCALPMEWQNSGFAQGIEPGMDPKWKESIWAIAEAFPARSAMPAAVMSAADIVSELRADIRSLNIARKAGMNTRKLIPVLLKSRAADEKSDPAAYKISAAMTSILATGLPTERQAVPRLWKIALEKLTPLPELQNLSGELKIARENNSYTLISSIGNAFKF